MVEYPSGWTCERVGIKLELYLLAQLSLEESLAMAEHLEACPGCSQCMVVLGLSVQVRRHG
jgi:Putative zinc-finger